MVVWYMIMRPKKTVVFVNLRFCLGVLLGYCIASTIRQICVHRPPRLLSPVTELSGEEEKQVASSYFLNLLKHLRPNLLDNWEIPRKDVAVADPERKLVLIGIMTADQYIDTRARAIYDTWAQAVSGKVLFFVGSASTYSGDLPVVRLPDVPQEDYPPQKKAFKMLEYMYDNYVDEYEWFFRADDDVYIKGDKIESLLRSINSSQPWYIGQSGEGRSHEQGKLGLIEDMPYCIGGPGVMISHVALAQLGPNIPSCMKSVTTKHEDTELGRCMQRTVGIGCSSAYELRKLMYQNYREKNGSFTHELGKEEKMALTLHPIKSAPYVYRMHNFVSAQNIQIMNDRVNKLQKEIKTMENSILKLETAHKMLDLETAEEDIQNGGVFPGTYVNDSDYVWEYGSGGVYFSHRSVHTKLSANGRVDESTSLAIAHSWARRLRASFPHNFMKIDKTLPSYIKVSPLDGVHMRVNLQVSYNKKEFHRIKNFFAPFELRQPFSALEFFEGKDYFRPFSEQNQIDPIRMLVPLSGKYKVLRRFLARHIPIVLKSEIPITVIFLLFQDADGEVQKNTDAIQSFQSIYPSCDIRLIDHSKESFSRSRALTYGANLFGNDSLLLFMDVDMIFTEDFARRVQLNTIQGKQVYFPIYFSQYQPDFICYQEEDCVVREMDMSEFAGIWRHYGFGMVGVYKSDFISVGGFDTSIKGWGKEDVDFHERVIAQKLMAFRSPDPGLLHLFHEKVCDNTLPSDQWRMCSASKADIWASTRTLVRMITQLFTPDLDDENDYFLLDPSSLEVIKSE